MQRINLSELSNIFQAYKSCLASNNDFSVKHEERINKILENLPHGSGIDSGVKFLWDLSKPDKLIFSLGYHHLNENGYYDGWTEHKLTVVPAFLNGYDMKISGINRNDIKDYLGDLFGEVFYTDPNYQVKRNAETVNQ